MHNRLLILTHHIVLLDVRKEQSHFNMSVRQPGCHGIALLSGLQLLRAAAKVAHRKTLQKLDPASGHLLIIVTKAQMSSLGRGWSGRSGTDTSVVSIPYEVHLSIESSRAVSSSPES